MVLPVCKILTYTGDTLDYTITTDALNIYCKEVVTDAVGHFSFLVPTKKNGGYYYDDIARYDIVKIYFGYKTVDDTPSFVGRVKNVSAPLSMEKGGYVRLISGLSQGEILLRRHKKNKYYNGTQASTIVSEWATDLGLGTGEIASETSSIYLEVRTKSYFDLLRWISDHWISAGTQIKRDFYVNVDGDLVWKPRPLRSAGVESFTVGDNILDYNVTHNDDDVKNNITVYGAAEKPVPEDRDSWTEPSADPPPGWTAINGTLHRGTLDPQVGTYYVTGRCDDPDGQTVDFYRTIPRQTIRDLKTVALWSGPSATCTAANIRLLTLSGTTAYFEASLSTAAAWTFTTLNLGPAYEYDAAKNPDGVWTATNSPNWWDITGIRIYATFSGSGEGFGISIDGLHLFPERWSYTASDISDGQRDHEVTDDKLHSDSECETRAKALLYQLKDTPTQIEISVPGNTNVLVGDRLSMTIPAEGISAVDYDIISVEHFFTNEPTGFQTKATMINSGNTRQRIVKTQADVMAGLKRWVRGLSIEERDVK